ncbi:MAG: 2-amino-4-hydroxy-6-hydroxymethyldihydropteridine diphosphokinase [Phycisphaerales bacterium]
MATDPVTAAVAVGSNLGDRQANITHALSLLAQTTGIELLELSTLRETAPVRTTAADPGGPFLNGAALLKTTLPPRDLLTAMHEVEARLGRDRTQASSGAPRTIDLDLLLYGLWVVAEPGLVVPHPRLAERQFVLEPLAEIAGSQVVPTLHLRVDALLAQLRSRP